MLTPRSPRTACDRAATRLQVGSFPPQPVPKDLAFLAVPWAAQATIVGGGFADLTTAVIGVSGTQ